MRRKEMLIAVIGGIVGAVLTMMVGSVLPLGAQSQSGNLGEIECTKLTIIDPNDGSKRVVLDQDEHGGRVRVLSVLDPDPLPEDSLAAKWGLERVPAEFRLSIVLEDKVGIAGERIREYKGHIFLHDDLGSVKNTLIFDEEDTLTCHGLHVNDPLTGKIAVGIRADMWGGAITVAGADGADAIRLIGGQSGGHLRIYGKESRNISDPVLKAFGFSKLNSLSGMALYTDDNGGVVNILNKRGHSAIRLFTSELGHGRVFYLSSDK